MKPFFLAPSDIGRFDRYDWSVAAQATRRRAHRSLQRISERVFRLISGPQDWRTDLNHTSFTDDGGATR
jgi:hypothetical protein